MRRHDDRTAPRPHSEAVCASFPRRAFSRLAAAAVLAAALLANPWASAGAEAARVTKPRPDQAQHRDANREAPATRGARPRIDEATRGKVTTATPPSRATTPALRVSARGRAAAPRAGGAKPAMARPAPPVRDAGDPSHPAVVAALGHATRTTGIDPTLLLALAWQESRLDPTARNRRSSARGLMQFTNATWLEVVRDFGPRHGLAGEAALLSTDARSGTITTRQPRQLTRILKLRDNPRLAAVMAAERIGREREALRQVLGRPPGPADLYLVHLLGPAGARQFLEALRQLPTRPAIEAVSRDGVALNREVFLARDTGRSRSLAEVHAWVAGSIMAQRGLHAPLLAGLGVPATDAEPLVEVAEAR